MDRPSHIFIPPGARPPVNPSPTARPQGTPWLQGGPEFQPPMSNGSLRGSNQRQPPPSFSFQSNVRNDGYVEPQQMQEHAQETWQMPQPQIYRSVSHHTSLQPPTQPRPRALSGSRGSQSLQAVSSTPSLRHKYSYSDGGHSSGSQPPPFERSPSLSPSFVSDEFGDLRLSDSLPPDPAPEIERTLEAFQNGDGEDNDWAWHLLVPKEARDSLPQSEVMRQSAVFDLVTGERGYVGDLELVQEIFVGGLRSANPPVIRPENLDSFISETFWNMDRVLGHHQRMLGALYSRQREQHPIVLNIGDVVLDTVLKFQSEYDSYIKHYPLAESAHRREHKGNLRYRAFLNQCSQDPRLGKRDVITFISRPVTRLPRLSLQLAEVKKRTEKLGSEESSSAEVEEHPDLETIPICLDVLDRFVKSTQPGIEAAESKVKFYAMGEALRFRKGEIIDMDLYNENRSLVYSGNLSRRSTSQTGWSGWADLEIGLLDNYVIMTKPDQRTGAKDVVSRPIPLEYLRLGDFKGAPESRREERSDGGLLGNLVRGSRQMYPLVIFHATSPTRRYTFYATSDKLRSKWREKLIDALGVRAAQVDANKIFGLNSVHDGFFRLKTIRVPPGTTTPFTGRIISAVTYSSAGKSMVAVATAPGIFVGIRGHGAHFVKVLNLPSAAQMEALQNFNRLLILYEGGLLSYSLDVLTRVALGEAQPSALNASLERIASPGKVGNVLFFRTGVVSGRTLVVFACKTFFNFMLYALEAVTSLPEANKSKQLKNKGAPSWRQYGEVFYVPREPFDVTLLIKTVAVSTDRFMTVVDPTKLSSNSPVPLPDFTSLEEPGCTLAGAPVQLKEKCQASKPIGLVRSGPEELLVVYGDFGCYVTKYGVPTRKCGFIRWETRATSYAERGPFVLLFSPQFIEIRHSPTGRLSQVMEGADIRLMQRSPLLIAWRGKKDDQQGVSEELVELVETTPIETNIRRDSGGSTRSNGSDPTWAEWE